EMAAAFAHGRLVEGGAIAGLVLLFVMGSFAGRLVAEATGTWRRPAVLILTASLLSIGVLLGLAPGQAALVTGTAAMVLAMGVQNAAMTRVGDARASLTYVTGTLVKIGETLADAVTGTGRLAGAAPYVALWLRG